MLEVEITGQYDHQKWPKWPSPWKTDVVNISKTKIQIRNYRLPIICNNHHRRLIMDRTELNLSFPAICQWFMPPAPKRCILGIVVTNSNNSKPHAGSRTHWSEWLCDCWKLPKPPWPWKILRRQYLENEDTN